MVERCGVHLFPVLLVGFLHFHDALQRPERKTSAFVCLAGLMGYWDGRNPTGAMTPTVAEG